MLARHFFPIKYQPSHFLVATWLVLVPFGSYAAENPPQHVCDRVVIDSVRGDVGIWRDKIAGFSRSRGLTGPIIWVDIVPPALSAADNKILKMFLWWTDHPVAGPVCRAGTDFARKPTMNCSEWIQGTQLRLELTFEPTARNRENQTDKLAKYVSDDVLCVPTALPAPGTKI
jgi:hypothetical protein